MPKEIISYLEFRKSAYRHFEICEKMLQKLVKADDCSLAGKSQVIQEIYYLSGYIIECTLKFVLFSHVGYKPNRSIYEYKDKDWKNHDFHKLALILSELNVKFSQDIPILGSRYGISNDILRLYNDWSTDYRYISNSSLQIELVEGYLSSIKEIKKKLFNQFK